ncbi:undecaprenyl/decaprenyl-phosphate alpha-N-acetylglucosaminyl 1-phosphate transferase [Fictibacillus sp. 7GRE50]|uniref:glycosyltransferase family 4 protein n=1 Tax=Fictibacillus sp. 7GRE50 TaxID=2745878 RepID=UPI0018CCC8C6|nr:MraY family glycosyltransferase [Fictibacillus sp. 7GRE50]MBH0164075.1 undecaprenyl/decaprenyl-phosphate alpha-N-acetylglucosaminyl 1-phosphate transferase [Fictibacillus sp. 7GRE50]
MDKTLIIAFGVSLLTVLAITPLVIKFAILIGATDKPNQRKVHQKVMPRLGGLAILIGVAAGYFTAGLHKQEVTGITVGALIIVILGILDDIYELSAKAKLAGQILAAFVIIETGLTIDLLNIPFIGKFELGLWAYPITLFWILAITNAINLIDGLDGLAAGISSIVILTVAVMAGINGNILILTLSVIILGSTFGFLFYNFNPAKIFMGDTGALFLGYSISVLSLLGLYKSVTLFSFIVPIIILGVPVFDTTFAIIRRIANKKPISAPDKGHLHHRLLSLGLSHKSTVLIIYLLSIIFSISAALFSTTTVWGAIAITFGLLLMLELIAEIIGLVHHKYRPILNVIKFIVGESLVKFSNKHR